MKSQAKNVYGDWMTLIGRILIAAMFLMAAIGKITNFGGTRDYMASYGFPIASVFLVLTIALQFVGSLALILGIWTRLFALLFALFVIATIFIFHPPWIAEQMGTFSKNTMITGGLLVLSAFGAGRISLDYKLRYKK